MPRPLGVATIILVSGLSLVAVPGAEASTGTGGSFVPVAPVRIADTSDGTGFGTTGSIPAATTRSFKVTGVGGVPTTNVGAVVVDLAGSSTADSRQYLYPSDESRNLAALSLGSNAGWDSTTFIVRPGSDGKVKLYNEAGTTQANVDVQGYFTATSSDSTTGGYVPITPTRIVDSAANKGAPSSFTGGTTYTVAAAGTNGIPSDAVGVFAGIRVIHASGDGGLRAVPSSITPSGSTPSVLNYGADKSYDSGAAIDLGPDGKLKLWASSANSSLEVVIDIQGYFTAGSGGGSFHPASNTRVWDSTNSDGGSLEPGEERTIRITGNGGLPTDGYAFGVAVLGLTVKDWTAGGALSVVNADLEDQNGTSNLRWGGTYAGVARQSMAFVGTSVDGEITIRNDSSGSVTVLINNQGWFDRSYEALDVLDPQYFDQSGPVAEDLTRFNLASQTIAQTSSAATRVFAVALDNGEEMTSDSAIQDTIVTDAGGEHIGDYSWDTMATDAQGGAVPVSVVTSGTSMSVTVAAIASSRYPVTLAPKFVGAHDQPKFVTQNHLYEKYELIDWSKVKNYVNKSDIIGACSVSTDDISCSVTKSKDSTRTIGLALGASKSFVAGELNISTATTVSVALECSAKIKKSQQLVASPIGSRHKYKIRKTKTLSGRTTVTTSGWRYTFNPYKNQFDCRVRNK